MSSQHFGRRRASRRRLVLAASIALPALLLGAWIWRLAEDRRHLLAGFPVADVQTEVFRSPPTSQTFELPEDRRGLRLELSLNLPERYTSYRILLTGLDRPVSLTRTLRPGIADAYHVQLTANFFRRDLPDGAYRLEVFGDQVTRPIFFRDVRFESGPQESDAERYP